MDVVHKSTGDKFIATTRRKYPSPPECVTIEPIMGISLENNEIGEAVFAEGTRGGDTCASARGLCCWAGARGLAGRG